MEGEILPYKFEGCSHSFLFGLEGRVPFSGLDSALTVQSMVTWEASGDNDAATDSRFAVCCCTISVDSCVVAIQFHLQCLRGY